MKTTLIVLLFLAASLAAQDMQSCPMHKQHMANSSGHHSDVQARGDQGMGFSQGKTTHHFRLYGDGGAIEVTANDSNDAESVQAIRSHLAHIAGMFSEGDFSIPMFVHDRVPPGVPAMQRKKAEITYTYEEMAAGARVQIKTTSVDSLEAVHDFLRFQIEEHQTGDPVDVRSIAQ